MTPKSQLRALVTFILILIGPTSAALARCEASQPDGPVLVTPDCVDAVYNAPIIDSETDETSPLAHRRVSGHFNGTAVRFNMYFQPKAQWDGRFFQLVYPTQDENATDHTIAFGVESGAYTVQITGTQGYRADAAAAKFSRTVAAEYYKIPASRHIYGYIYGGSGGSFQTVGAIENTRGVWDGAVPIVQAVPVSLVLNYGVRQLAAFVLEKRKSRVVDAVRPGGSGDPFEGLDAMEEGVLREATLMGMPLGAWEDYGTALNGSNLVSLGSLVRSMDPSYVDDFWSAPGYLGTDPSDLGELFRAALINAAATIESVEHDADDVPSSLTLSRVPSEIPHPVGLDFTVYSADGNTEHGTLSGSLDVDGKVFRIGNDNDPALLGNLTAGMTLRIDNRWFLALHTYHRHQVPTRRGFHGFDQFQDGDGQPLYPQRDIEVAKEVAISSSGGGTHTGQIKGKVIVIDNLLDQDAFPWHADWYRAQVQEALGARSDDSYRLWYNENADHEMGEVSGESGSRLVDFRGIYEQALRDVSSWAEDGIAPPRSSRYQVSQGQVRLAATAGQRRGIQPVIAMTADGAAKTQVPVGRSVTLRARMQVPPHAGQVTSVEWDFQGRGEFVPGAFQSRNGTVDVEATVRYEQAGTYFPGIRAGAQRSAGDRFGRALNLGRARVDVE